MQNNHQHKFSTDDVISVIKCGKDMQSAQAYNEAAVWSVAQVTDASIRLHLWSTLRMVRALL